MMLLYLQCRRRRHVRKIHEQIFEFINYYWLYYKTYNDIDTTLVYIYTDTIC